MFRKRLGTSRNRICAQSRPSHSANFLSQTGTLNVYFIDGGTFFQSKDCIPFNYFNTTRLHYFVGMRSTFKLCNCILQKFSIVPRKMSIEKYSFMCTKKHYQVMTLN